MLPATGREGDAPDWPLEVPEPNQEEIDFWNRIWQSPQAILWEADQTYDLVAFYVRTHLEAMHPRAGAQARTFARQLAESLYLTGPALASGRYVIQQSSEARAIQAARDVPIQDASIARRGKRARAGLKVLPFERSDADKAGEPTEDDGAAPHEPPF